MGESGAVAAKNTALLDSLRNLQEEADAALCTAKTRPSCISPIFAVLVDVVKEHGGNAAPALRSNIMSVLEQRGPFIYERAGVKGFNEYMKLAMNAGVIMEGGKGPLRWVSFHPVCRFPCFGPLQIRAGAPFLDLLEPLAPQPPHSRYKK